MPNYHAQSSDKTPFSMFHRTPLKQFTKEVENIFSQRPFVCLERPPVVRETSTTPIIYMDGTYQAIPQVTGNRSAVISRNTFPSFGRYGGH
ncbi:hypothetical protein B9Z55_019004 [Caenorhabditis nigoni]|uniref:Uncharacterized protein n=1 Tax=Caenorhabditis nigoni TaxID=1611254 RepID=A0A2G5TGG7_9PELO|nr:hypothetical protein B9Z55_019004 [Caenorhabditis nigoni]